jgi:hypothetical protein
MSANFCDSIPSKKRLDNSRRSDILGASGEAPMHLRPSNEAIDQVIADQIKALKNVQKFFRKQENMEATMAVLRQLPTIPITDTAERDHAVRPQPNWDSGLKAAVIRAHPRVSGNFSYREVEAVMTQDRYDFKNSDRRNAINGVLRQLVADGVLIEVQKGTPGKPTIYRHAGEQSK